MFVTQLVVGTAISVTFLSDRHPRLGDVIIMAISSGPRAPDNYSLLERPVPESPDLYSG